MKQIAYLVIDNGIDGREKDTVVEAFWNEGERNAFINQSPNKGYYSTGEKIVDVEVDTKAAMAKLNGLDRLLLGVKRPVIVVTRKPAKVPSNRVDGYRPWGADNR